MSDEIRRLIADVAPRAIVHTSFDARAYGALSHADDVRLNIAPVETLMSALGRRPDCRFIHTGSAWTLPSGDRLAEDVEALPRSPYASAKARVDRALAEFGHRTGVPWINLRLFNIFGRHERPTRLLPYLVARLTANEEACLSHGTQVRDFNDVDDIATAFLAALGAPRDTCQRVYHIGSGQGTTAREFAMTVARFTGNAHLIRFDASNTADADLPCLVANPALAESALGWTPVLDLPGRIRRAVDWWRIRIGREHGHVTCAGVDS